MRQENRRHMRDNAMGRREALGVSALAVLGVLAGSARAGERGGDARDAMPETMRRLMEEAERMRDAGPEERLALMRERAAARNQQAIDNLKEQLRISDAEWQVVRPRLEAVYNLVRPTPQIAGQDAPARSELDKAMQELREALADEDADAATIKARLAAVRNAKERANQRLAAAQKNLRQLLTLRQEAILVLNGLLD